MFKMMEKKNNDKGECSTEQLGLPGYIEMNPCAKYGKLGIKLQFDVPELALRQAIVIVKTLVWKLGKVKGLQYCLRLLRGKYVGLYS